MLVLYEIIFNFYQIQQIWCDYGVVCVKNIFFRIEIQIRMLWAMKAFLELPIDF